MNMMNCNCNTGLEVGSCETLSGADAGAGARGAEALLASDDHPALLPRLPDAPSAAARRRVRESRAPVPSGVRHLPIPPAAGDHDARDGRARRRGARPLHLHLHHSRPVPGHGVVRSRHPACVAPLAQPPDRRVGPPAARSAPAGAPRGASVAQPHVRQPPAGQLRRRAAAAALCAFAAAAGRLRLPPHACHRAKATNKGSQSVCELHTQFLETN